MSSEKEKSEHGDDTEVLDMKIFHKLFINTKLIQNIPAASEKDELSLFYRAKGSLMSLEDFDELDDEAKRTQYVYASRPIREFVENLSQQTFISVSDKEALIKIVRAYHPQAEIPLNPTLDYLVGILKPTLKPSLDGTLEEMHQIRSAVERVIVRGRIRDMGITTFQQIASMLPLVEGRPLEQEASAIRILKKENRLHALAEDLIPILLDHTNFGRFFKSFADKRVRREQMKLHRLWPSIEHYEDDIESLADLFVREYCKVCMEIDKHSS